ncbi:MAG TPA: hypothetical protein VEV39_09215 [Gemmatimonadales bacterium]|nr:hypothetical protein [Gemmatimonadales bacterium]
MNRLATLINAVADFGFAGVFLVTWIAPDTFGTHTVKFLLLVMLMEFIVVHSSTFMGNVVISKANRGTRAAVLVGFGFFYSLFAGAFALAFKTWWPITMFWGQTLNRLLGVLFGQVPDDEQKAFIQRSWVASVLFYLLGAFVTIILPIPRLGVTAAVVAAQQIHATGLWPEQPQRVLAFGVLYFVLTGLSDLKGHSWAPRPTFTSRA